VTKALPFTALGLARAMKGVAAAGKFVVGVKPDGTLIVGDKPVDVTSLVPVPAQDTPAPKRRIGEKVHGGQGAAGGA
jgi:hypothetical protein